MAKLLLEHIVQEGLHRRALEANHLESQIAIQQRALEVDNTMHLKDAHTQRFGMIIAFLLAAAMIFIAALLFTGGNNTGGSVVTGAIATIVGIFVFHRKTEENGISAKESELPQKKRHNR